MILRWVVAALHLLGLGIGLGAVVARARALRGPLDAPGLRRVFAADAWWGVAALVWFSTGLWRAFGGLEKGSGYYLQSNAFWVKMSLLAVITAMEFYVAATIGRWRAQVRRGEAVDTARAGTFATISAVQAALVVAMVFAATAMARGLFF